MKTYIYYLILSLSLCCNFALSNIKYSGGVGDSKDPFQLETIADLLLLSEETCDWDMHFILNDAIEITDTSINFSPIGTYENPFSGVFNGNNKTIYFYRVNTSRTYSGFFGYVENAEITDFALYDAVVKGGPFTGVLVGFADDKTEIFNCYTSGLVSHHNDNTIKSAPSISITKVDTMIDLSELYSSQTIDSNRYYGGLVGYLGGKSSIEQSCSDAIIYGNNVCGGLVGALDDSDISTSFASGDVSASSYAGGLVGFLIDHAKVDECFATGNITTTMFGGGLVAYSDSKSSITDTYACGRVRALFYAGGHLAYGSPKVKDSFFDIQSTDQLANSGDANAKSTVQMKAESTYDKWDMRKTWSIVDSINNGYPHITALSQWHFPVVSFFWGTGAWRDSEKWTHGIPHDHTFAFIKGDCILEESAEAFCVIVDQDASLYVKESASLDNIMQVIVRDGESESGEYYKERESVHDTVFQECYYRAGVWNFVTLPFDIKASELMKSKSLATSWSDPDGDYWLMEYSESQRASQGSGMVSIYDDNYILRKGIGYMVWISEAITESYIYLSLGNVNVVESECSSGTASKHTGWNLLGNPFAFSLTYDDVFSCPVNQDYFTGAVYVWDGIGYRTWTKDGGDIEASEIQPIEAFYVKRSLDVPGDIDFCLSKGECSCVGASNDSSLELDNRLVLKVQCNEEYDNVYLYPHDDENTLSNNAEKLEFHNAYRPIIYSYDTEMIETAVCHFDYTDEIPLVINLNDSYDVFKLYVSIEGGDYMYFLNDFMEGTKVQITNGDSLIINTFLEQDFHDRFSITLEMDTGIPSPIDYNEENISLIEVRNVDGMAIVQSLSDNSLSLLVYGVDGILVNTIDILPNQSVSVTLKNAVSLLSVSDGNRKELIKVIKR